MNKEQQIEEQLWSYIDGCTTADEKNFVEQMLATRADWNAKYKATLTKADIEKYGKNGLSFFNLTKIDTTHINDTTKITTTRCIFPAGEAVTLITTDITHSSEAVNKESNTVFSNKHLSKSIYWKFVGLVFLLILYVTMVYGPIAAFLVELFPTKIRYTSMSLPYHIGNGVFGGLVPFIGLLLTTTYPADPLVGLWYPIGVATLCLVIGTMYLTNKIDGNVKD